MSEAQWWASGVLVALPFVLMWLFNGRDRRADGRGRPLRRRWHV